MSGPNPSKLGKSQMQENPITRSQVKKNIKLAKFVAQNQTGPLKPKRTVTVREKVTKDKFENISSKKKTSISFQLDNISLEKTLTFEQFETVGTSNLSDSNNLRNSNSKTNSSIICGSIDQDETLKNQTTHIDNVDISLLNSTIIPKNNQQVSLRDALEVVPLFDGSNIPLSHFIEGCYKAKAMLPTPAAQENLGRLLRSKLSGEARKCIFGST